MVSISRSRFLFLSGLVLCLALWLRATQLYSLPIFGDEANHLYWSQQFSLGGLDYPLLMDGKYLMGVLVAAFHPAAGPAPLWLARLVIGLFASLSVAACIGLGAQLLSREAGLLAGLLYAVLPQAVLHERQMLADPLMSAFGAVAIFLTWRLARRGSLWLAVGLALALAAAFLTKLFGGLYLAYPALAILMLTQPGTWKRSLVLQSAAVALAALFAGAFLWALRSRLGDPNGDLFSGRVGTLNCPPLVCQGSLPGQAGEMTHNLSFIWAVLQTYFGWPIVLAAALAWPLASAQLRRRTAWLALAGAGTLAVMFFVADELPPRYLLFINAPIVTLGALGVVGAIRRLTALLRRPVWSLAAGAGLMALTLAPMGDTAWLVWSPRQAALTFIEVNSFQTGVYRAGFREAAAYITSNNRGPLQPYVIVQNKFDRSLSAYLDSSRIRVFSDAHVDLNEIGRQMLAGRPVYAVDILAAGAGEPVNLPFEARELARYAKNDGQEQVRVSQLGAADANQRAELFRRYFTLPEQLKSNYSDLVQALPSGKPLILLVYPPNHAPTVASLAAAVRPGVDVVSIGDSWPLDPAALNAELARATSAGGDIRVIFDQETGGDPNRLIETWLTTNLFRLNEQWFGPVRLLTYAGGAAGPAVRLPIEAMFGPAMRLDSLDILDPVQSPGGTVRLRLTWTALGPMNRQYKIFTHVFSGNQILAQHDSQPAGELRPTTTWHPGDTIVDQFAIRLPPDAQPGDYTIRVGVYDLSTQVRLPMELPDEGTTDYFVGGDIRVK